MLKKSIRILSVYTLLLGISQPAISYDSAIDSTPDEIRALRRAVVKTPARLIDSTTIPGKIIVSVTDPGPLDQTGTDTPLNYGIQGKLPQGLIAFLERNRAQYLREISSAAQNRLPSTEFFFTGHGQGGQIALVLSAIWWKEYIHLTNGISPSNNQIKAITFSSPSSSDEDFNRSIAKLLGTTNIIDFSSYFNSQPITYGIPIYTLPDEKIFDMITTISSRNLTLGTGIALVCYFWPNFALSVLENSGSTSKAFVVLTPYAVLALKIYSIYKNNRWVPSENLTVQAFEYAQDNYHTNEEAELDIIGRPPLLSMQRGLGYWMRRMLGM